MRTVHRLVGQTVEVCAEHHTGGWRDAGGEEGKKVMQHDRDSTTLGKKMSRSRKVCSVQPESSKNSIPKCTLW